MEFHTLRRLVTPAIRAEARVVYPPANPAMTLFRFVPVRSILEAVEGPLFEAFQSAIMDYFMIANGPDAPDVMFGIDFHELETRLREEWNRLGRRPLTLRERVDATLRERVDAFRTKLKEERRQEPFVGTTRPQRAPAAIDAKPVAIPPTVVVLWEGAEHTKLNVRRARVRTAYLEAHRIVVDAMADLDKAGHPVSKRTFYNHLNALDELVPGWR